MAERSLPAFSLPGFPQLIDRLLTHEITKVNRQLQTCSDDTCFAPATICELKSGSEFCGPHFQERSR